MYAYHLLEPGCMYLVQERQDSSVTLMKVALQTDSCVYLHHYHAEGESLLWKRRKEELFDILECLDDKTVEAWKAAYHGSGEFGVEESGEEDEKY